MTAEPSRATREAGDRLVIIIMAGMAVVKRGWLPHRGEAQMAYNYRFPTRTMFSQFQNLEGKACSDE